MARVKLRSTMGCPALKSSYREKALLDIKRSRMLEKKGRIDIGLYQYYCQLYRLELLLQFLNHLEIRRLRVPKAPQSIF